MLPGRRIRVRGQVQGVGFRPFVWQLAQRSGLIGEVCNDPEGVLIVAYGDRLDDFERALRNEAPALAQIDAVESEALDYTAVEGFSIAASRGSGNATQVTPDAATCIECLAEMRDPARRRFAYPFTNCTHCGPRFTIVHALPYDRARTTMARFALCEDCAAEYADPGDRRFHAQPVACPRCGPRLWLEPGGTGNAIADAAARLRRGEILAIKGLGGFHLAADAADDAALARLRQRKQRPAKPLAVMGTMGMIRDHALMSRAEAALLREPAAPIVLLEKAGQALSAQLAPGLTELGWMLPYTPLHHLLLDAFGGPLVMTSANASGEPQVTGNEEAREKLAGIADACLMHDRDIARRLDDSLQRVTPYGTMTLRRARGRVPGTLPLPQGFQHAPRVAAYGGQRKAAICLIQAGRALLGHHLGEDLDEALTWDAFLQADRDYAGFFDHRAELVACDLHAEFRSSRHAAQQGLPLVQVQHHHAHLAACLGENGWPLEGGRVAGIILDGLGTGTDGTLWGGELLLGDYRDYERRHWLRPAPLPGGDAAQREPWRNLVMRLDQARLSDLAENLCANYPVALIRQVAAAGVNSPLSSSAGRLFDAFAAALGVVVGAQSFEGEAAMRLEALARQMPDAAPYPFGFDGPEIDPAPLFKAWAADREAGCSAAAMAARFHAGLAVAFCAKARALVESGEAQAVALSGGCFQNVRLLDLVVRSLGKVPVLLHSAVPANDGGLAFGQALVAAARFMADWQTAADKTTA